MLHISDIKQFSKCPIYYHLNKTSHESYFSFYRNEFNLVDIYKEIFDIKECFVGNVGDDSKLALNNINNFEYFINARFASDDLRIKVSLLQKNNNGFSLYFFKPLVPKELDLDSMFIVYDVLKNNGVDVNYIGLIYVDKSYILKDKINFKEIIKITNIFNDNEIIDLVKNNNFDYKNLINKIEQIDESNLSCDLKRTCSLCEYFDDCFNSIENDSILHLVSSKYKFDMFQNNLRLLKNVDINQIDGTSLQYAQIMASRNNGLFIDKNRIKEFLSTFDDNPITFIDFEWDMFLFPKYKNMKCFGILPFEFSLYTKSKDQVYSFCYVGKGDCRKEFIETLISKIPSKGTIVAFNSFSAEVLRLKELAEQFPEYKTDLENIINRFVDIAEIFSKGMYYDIRFKGQLSLKKIVSIISDISYSDLDVKNGLDAVHKFRKYDLNNNDEIKKELEIYCNQDAYSLLVIYNYLVNLI